MVGIPRDFLNLDLDSRCLIWYSVPTFNEAAKSAAAYSPKGGHEI
jgi:hypothetical protein